MQDPANAVCPRSARSTRDNTSTFYRFLCRKWTSGGSMNFSARKVTNRDIRSYYTHAATDYWAAWLNGRNLAMHFGYQEDNTMGHSASLTNATEVLADIAKVSAGDRVLDAGCGLGGTTLWLASRRRAQVTGIALGVDQIGSARSEAVRRAVSNRGQF